MASTLGVLRADTKTKIRSPTKSSRTWTSDGAGGHLLHSQPCATRTSFWVWVDQLEFWPTLELTKKSTQDAKFLGNTWHHRDRLLTAAIPILTGFRLLCIFVTKTERTEKERCKNLVTERFVHITADIGFWSCHPKILVTKIKIQLRKSLSSLELLSVILRHEGFWKSQQLVRVIGAQALSRVCNNGYVMAGQV